MGRIDTLLDQCGSLSSAPVVIARVASMLSSGEYDPGEVEKLILADEAISASVLRAVNSAQYGVPGRVFDLREGIIRLGSNALRQIVLQQKSTEMFGEAGEAYGLRRQDLWRGAIGGAFAAEQIAEDRRVCDPGLAYVTGLLRDIGKLVVDAAMGAKAFRTTPAGVAPTGRFVEEERELLGVDHAELGAALAERWGLPTRICNAIKLHHSPAPLGKPGADVLTDVVHAADFITLWSGLCVGDDGLRYELAEHVRESLEFNRVAAERQLVETMVRIREMEDAISDRPDRGAA